jgi:hypothetical protein
VAITTENHIQLDAVRATGNALFVCIKTILKSLFVIATMGYD